MFLFTTLFLFINQFVEKLFLLIWQFCEKVLFLPVDSEYSFERQGRTVARVSKAFFGWTDIYGIDIEEGEDDITILRSSRRR